jgi:hypothetical protein
MGPLRHDRWQERLCQIPDNIPECDGIVLSCDSVSFGAQPSEAFTQVFECRTRTQYLTLD